MKLYHSTINSELEEIYSSQALIPNQASPEDKVYVAEWAYMGLYKKSSSEHIYLWKDIHIAIECAKFISKHAKFEYSSVDKKPVVIEVNILNELKISDDPDSSGLRYKGQISIHDFLNEITDFVSFQKK